MKRLLVLFFASVLIFLSVYLTRDDVSATDSFSCTGLSFSIPNDYSCSDSELTLFVPDDFSCPGLDLEVSAPSSAICYDIKVFDTNWNQLTPAQMSQLEPGDTVRFTVQGISSSGEFTKAKFTINGVQRPEVTNKRPGTNEFYDEYTIPQGTLLFNITAQVYHESLGWM